MAFRSWHQEGEEPYDVMQFATKHGLTEKAAKVILATNGPSRRQCDAAAVSFLEAKAWRSNGRVSLYGVDDIGAKGA